MVLKLNSGRALITIATNIFDSYIYGKSYASDRSA